MEESLYHLLLEGRTVGPYDRRTIVGMRMKNALADDSVLIGADGRQLTVVELVRGMPGASLDFSLTGTFSIVKARFDAQLASSDKAGPLPRYDDQVELRVQPDVLRIAGRLRGKDDRVKIPLGDVVHAQARDAFADLWFKGEGGGLQAASFAMESPEAAKRLVGWLPDAKPPPAAVVAGGRMPLPVGIVVAIAGAVLAVVVVVVLLAVRGR